MQLRMLMIMIVVGVFAFGCTKGESSSPENVQGGLGAEAPVPSKTNALSHGASSSHPQTFGQEKFSPKGGYAPTYEYSPSDNDKEKASSKKSGGY
ncbi:MAG TPA: hypothetical protein EYN74_00050 [Nitrospirales bacterium]|nr:hypothetical protein [Nitrospirales bacterium]HIB53924.1 hypothetical protein [Nitrospirales bacterium]HIN33497.1 hypothetical protein [Nitrospirales bacterium]